MPTTVTNTIGSTGDYPDIATWEAACPTNLVTADQIWRGECLNEEFVSSSTFGSIAGMTTDSTRYVELTAAAGASFVDHADRLTNPLRYDASKGAAFRMTGFYTAILSVDASYTRVSRLQFYGTQGNNYGVAFAVDGRADQIIHASSGAGVSCGPRCTMTNVLSILLRNTSSVAFTINSVSFAASYFYNCIAVRPSDYTSGGNAFQTSYNNLEIKNCAVFGFATFASVAAGSASGNNNATNLASVGFGTSNQTSLTFANQIEQPNATTGLDCRTKAGAALIDNGADLSASGVTTDIVGTARGATYDIGVWEIAAGAAYTLTLTYGAFTLTGQAVALRAARKLALAQGSFALTGQAVALRAARKLALAQGSFSLTGQAVALRAARKLALAQGSFALTGQAVALRAARKLALAQGSFSLTGHAITFAYSGGGYSLTLSAGVFALTGQAVGLRADRRLVLSRGSFTLTGQSVGLQADVFESPQGFVIMSVTATIGQIVLVSEGPAAQIVDVTEQQSRT